MRLQNISKFVQLNDFILLEYEFNRTGDKSYNFNEINPHVLETSFGKVFFENSQIGESNNTYGLFSLPNNVTKSEWSYIRDVSGINRHPHALVIHKPENISDARYNYDTVKVHIVSGYQFQDVDGFLLQINVDTNSGNQAMLSNFTWTKEIGLRFDKCIFFNNVPINIGNKSYDKHIRLEIPSIYSLGIDPATQSDRLVNILDVRKQSDVYIGFGTIPLGYIKTNQHSTFILNEDISTQFTPISVSDNFNCFMAESTNGDYIEYFATWGDDIIGNVMDQIEGGVINLHTSSNPNDNYNDFDESWGDARVWVIAHDIVVSEIFANGQVAITQKMTSIQEDEYSIPRIYRPIILNSDVITSFNIQYTCRMVNRMDGSQIIRKASFTSMTPKKYGRNMKAFNPGSIYKMNVFNKINGDTNITNTNPERVVTKYIKLYVNLNNVSIDGTADNIVRLNRGSSFIKFKLNNTVGDQTTPIDLTQSTDFYLVTNYGNSPVRISPTYSTNMNLLTGELEFEITSDVSESILKNENHGFHIVSVSDSYDITLCSGTFQDALLRK